MPIARSWSAEARLIRRPLIAALVVGMLSAGGLAGANPSEDAAGESVSSSSGLNAGTSQSTRRDGIAERVVIQVGRLDLARLTAAAFGDGEVLGPDNRDQMP